LSDLQEALMAIPITTAGQAAEPAATSPRREAIKAIRAKLRQSDITDDEYDDALEALVELTKD
jgi:hypothetical protein